MAADALAPCIARPSTAMVLIMHYKQVFVLHQGGLSYLCHLIAGTILCIHPANERQRYNVTSLIGWVDAQNYACIVEKLQNMQI